MQQTTGVAVLATHLAATDRRALSEAWYSALHFAAAPAPRRAAAGGGPPAEVRPRPAPAGEPARPRVPDGPARARPLGAPQRREVRGAGVLERRAPKTDLTKRLERALLRRFPRATQAQFGLSTAGGRVQLLVRADGTRTRVVAVCAPALRERVERALAQARFALAAHAVRCEAA